MRLVVLVRGFVRLGRRDQFRLLAVWSLLGFGRLAVLVLPFRLIRRFLGEDAALSPEDAPEVPAPSDRDRARAITIGTHIAVAARHTPWKSECYPQALVARTLLSRRRIPHRTSFGLRRDQGSLAAHVWVRAGDVAVCGGDGQDYTEVASFLWTPGAKGSKA